MPKSIQKADTIVRETKILLETESQYYKSGEDYESRDLSILRRVKLQKSKVKELIKEYYD